MACMILTDAPKPALQKKVPFQPFMYQLMYTDGSLRCKLTLLFPVVLPPHSL